MKLGMLFTLVLLSTFQSYYFYDLEFAPLPILGVLFFFILTLFNCANPKTRLLASRRKLVAVIIIAVILLASIANGLLGARAVFTLKTPAGFLIGLIVFVAISLIPFSKTKIFTVVRAVLLIHTVMWLSQAVVFYSSGLYIDPLAPITGEIQRFMHPGIEPFIRPTGFFNEPSTYCLYITAYGSLLMRHGLKVKDKFVLFLCIATVFGSFSSLGIVYGVFLVCSFTSYCIAASGKKFLALVLPIALTFILAKAVLLHQFGVMFNRLIDPFSEASGIIRLTYGLNELSQFGTFSNYLFGWGLGNNDVVNNAGMAIVYLLSFFGLIGTVLLLVAFSLLIRRPHTIVTLGLILLNASILQHPVFWVWLGLASLLSEGSSTEANIENGNVAGLRQPLGALFVQKVAGI